MTLKQIIANAATILGLGDVVDLVRRNRPADELLANTNYSLLLRCMALVCSKIAANQFELVHGQEFNVSVLRRIYLTDLEHNLISIKRVQHNGRDVDFELHLNFIQVPPGRIRLTYTFSPRIKDGSEQNPFPLPPEILEYGVLSEYAFINGMFNEAMVWNEKMGELLFSSLHKTGRSIKMPASF